ncbi:NAD(P)-dependent alcohol dehydrogenase [Streptomonospora sp. S1-112]|uniref:NAD(P)-dependent alcohol dehydrogenase n=1 Tax=Streptomonospora mangrovi TaxID=2883123 RepID=A0A9X3NMZ2_9ACTN|nr:NAD(P)-dependent alcohol dehydrogenase [Streptomonospora mangrovi]MDA0566462.1 NAD(P)-dependent alcohol dehydrogenase [Streptomonospora mangrovi]
MSPQPAPTPVPLPPAMRAVVCRRYGPPDVLDVARVPVPRAGDTDVLVRVEATTVDRADSAARMGSPVLARLAFGLRRPRNPVLGSAAAGVVAACGEGVGDLRVGDRVVGVTGTSFGAHAEYVVLARAGVTALPPAVSAESAVAIADGGLTALPFLRDHARLRAGQRVLVNGASGSVGSAAVQLAKHLGASVTGVCGPTNTEVVAGLGADEVIDRTAADFTRIAPRGGFDLVFDAVGTSSFTRCRPLLKPGGAYLTPVPGAAVLLQTVWTARLGRHRAAVAFTGLRPVEARAADLDHLLGLTATGALKAVIDSRYPLAQAAQAHRRVDTGHKTGVVVLTV